MGESPRFSFTRGSRFNFGWVIYMAVLFLATNIVLQWHMSWYNETSGVFYPYTSQSEARLSKKRLWRDDSRGLANSRALANSRGVADFLDSYGPPLPVTAAKRWSALTNGRPWEVAYKTGCEAYFGNGFFELLTFPGLMSEKPAPLRTFLLRGDGAQSGDELPGWFRCRRNSALGTSICEGGRVAMHIAKVHMSRGGEPIQSIVGRADGEEIPSFEEGAFEIAAGGGNSDSRSRILAKAMVVDSIFSRRFNPDIHVFSNLLQAMRVVPSVNCTKVVTQPTLFVSRHEYANLFHTVTEWYSAYVTARVSGLEAPPPLVFLDGHAQSSLDDGWRALFPEITRAKELEGTVCYEHAIFVPLGYTTVIFENIDGQIDELCVGCAPGAELGAAPVAKEGNTAGPLQGSGLGEGQLATARLREFGEVVSRAWGGDHRPWSWANWKEGEMGGPFGTPLEAGERDLHVLFVRRENYMAHPRNDGHVETRLDNEEEVLVALRSWAAEWAGVSGYDEIERSLASKRVDSGHVVIENGRLAHMTFEEQMSAVRRAAVIVGAHGAGLTHLLFARPGTEIVEIIIPSFKRPHFQKLSAWRGDVHYQPIHCDSRVVKPEAVVKVVRSIATRLLGRPPRWRP